MIFLLTSFFIFAQQEPYSPEKYREQTQHCHFLKNSPPTHISHEPLFTSHLQKMRQLYPLSSPWISEEAFLEKLGEALYKNEANCQIKNLTHWNKNEEFPSLGLPHAIWYGTKSSKKYQEQFPELIRSIRKNLKSHEKVKLTWPTLLKTENIGAAPWENASEFAKIQNTSLEIESSLDSAQLSEIEKKKYPLYKQAFELFELRHFLANPIVLRLQASYVVEKTFLSLHQMISSVHQQSPTEAQKIYLQIQQLIETQEGVLAIIDYLNFKGDGLKPSERTTLGHYSWGLLTVLELMPSVKIPTADCQQKTTCANRRFAQAALCTLQRLAYFSGPIGSQEQTQRYAWLNGGWKTRIESNYLPGTFAQSRCSKETPKNSAAFQETK